jgi:RNA polymerase sigma factor (sigma-70 family)
VTDQEQILQAIAKNDRKALESIYKENFSMIQSHVLNNNGSVDDARDIFQEAMIVVYQKSISGNFELNCQLKTYLFSICRRLWLKKLHEAKNFMAADDNLEQTVSVEEELENHEKVNNDYIIMESALSKLGEPCKSLIEAYYFQKKNMQEIAANFGYTNADNAKTQKYKCLMRLKKLFFTK